MAGRERKGSVSDLYTEVFDFVVEVANNVLEGDDDLVSLGYLYSQARDEVAVDPNRAHHRHEADCPSAGDAENAPGCGWGDASQAATSLAAWLEAGEIRASTPAISQDTTSAVVERRSTRTEVAVRLVVGTEDGYA